MQVIVLQSNNNGEQNKGQNIRWRGFQQYTSSTYVLFKAPGLHPPPTTINWSTYNKSPIKTRKLKTKRLFSSRKTKKTRCWYLIDKTCADMCCVRSLPPELASHRHTQPRPGPGHSQKHCKNFSNLKACKFSSRLSGWQGGRGPTWTGRGNCKMLANVPGRAPPAEGGRGRRVCFVQICKLSWRGLPRCPAPLGKVVTARNSSLCRHWPGLRWARQTVRKLFNNPSI